MFLLTDQTKHTVSIHGKEYPLNLTLYNILILLEVMEDPLISPWHRVELGIFRLIGERIDIPPSDKAELFGNLIKEYIADPVAQQQPLDLNGDPMPHNKKPACYSFQYDAGLIYAAFMQTYRIDLLQELKTMQWNMFKALFQGLSDETQFCKVVSLRAQPYPTGKGRHIVQERKALREQKRRLSYPGRDFAQESEE